jgi:hypothetical protein
MTAIPEEVANDLSAKVARINVLQRLILQDDFISLRGKEFAKQLEACGPINEEIREFLLDLLNQELGVGAGDPFARIGIDMTPEKASALDKLLTRMTQAANAPQQAPAVAQPEAPPAPRRLSPLEIAAGGADAFRNLSTEEKVRLAKEQEQKATITYKS